MIVYGINVWCVLVPGKDLIMASVVARQIHETADETAAKAAEDLRPDPFARVKPCNNQEFLINLNVLFLKYSAACAHMRVTARDLRGNA